jgi:MFS family permease
MVMGETLELLRRRPAFRRLWLADTISTMGDWFSLVALCSLSTESADGGVMLLASVLAAHQLPQALLAPIAGWLADRIDRKAVLVAGNTIEAILTMAMIVAVAHRSIAAVQMLLLARSATSALREPAVGASVPRLVSPDELPRANALGAATWSFAFVAGMALGGIATEMGARWALAIDAMSFLVATALLARLPPLPPEGADARRTNPPTVLDDLREAISTLRGDRRLRSAVFAKAPMAVVAGAGWIALNVVARDHAFAVGAATTLGLLQATRGVGTGLGPLAARVFARGPLYPRSIAHLAAGAIVLGGIVVAAGPGAAGVLVAAFVWGLGGGALWVITLTEIQQASPDRVRGRMIAIDTMGFTTGMSAGGFLCAGAIMTGIPLLHATVVIALAAAIAWIAIRVDARQISTLAREQ